MSDNQTGVIFSDLDGTFLDAHYSPVLDPARFIGIALRWHVVWASSRTVEELLHMQRFLNSAEDAIGENGGVFVTRSADTARALGSAERIENVWAARLASPHDIAKEMVREAFSETGARYRTLDELAPHDLARRARYGVADAVRAQRRRTSVLLCDVDRASSATVAALEALRTRGCTVAHGGHWISVVHGSDKGRAALSWLTNVSRQRGQAPHPVVAVGNSDNDEPLLRVADRRFVIRDPVSGWSPRLAALAGAEHLQSHGTAGWIEMIRLLDRDYANANS